jgi:hypothetical protein
MSPDPDRFDRLLPVVHRLRDAALGGPLRELLQVIGEQADLLEADIAQLYANWFIETCEDWVVPYIGDLIGYRPVSEAGLPDPAAATRGRLLSARREIANTIANRRRKGTLAILEQLANDVAGWQTRAVELHTLLLVSQSLGHLRPERGRTVDLRDADALDRLGGAFDELAGLVDVRRIGSGRASARRNITNVALFVWRLRPYSVTRAPAPVIDRTPNRFTFSILGNDTRLLTKPVEEPTPTHIADEHNVPAEIRRRALDERTADYYGPDRSLAIWREDPDDPNMLVPLEQLVPADLSGWAYRPQRGQVVIDPVLGRIAFPPREAPKRLWVSYHYGFSDDLGGGEYWRPLRPLAGRHRYPVGRGQQDRTIVQALQRWQNDKQSDPTRRDAVIEITDNDAYRDPLEISMGPDDRLELRAAQGVRPAIGVLDFSPGWDSVKVQAPTGGDAGTAGTATPGPCGGLPDADRRARLVLDGLLIGGGAVSVDVPMASLTIRHCTLVPGWTLDAHCEARFPESPSVVLKDTGTSLLVQRSIIGTIIVDENEVEADPITVTVADSILDATRRDLEAVAGSEGRHAHAALTVLHSTVFGVVTTHAVALAENSIFEGRVDVARRGTGCMRFSSVPPQSRTPPRYACQPDLVLAAVRARLGPEPLTPAQRAQRDSSEERERRRVRPLFNSTHYGTQDYCQLAAACAAEIAAGAEDESEMGAFHDLFQPQRKATLATRLDEFTPAGMDAGIIDIT